MTQEIDLSTMSFRQLKVLLENVVRAMKAAELRERKNALAAMDAVAKDFGFTMEELIPIHQQNQAKGQDKRSRSGPKYADPKNPNHTWSGNGRKPQWFHDALKRGITPDEMLISSRSSD